jgi:Ca2+-binding RTX toxin-like protein
VFHTATPTDMNKPMYMLANLAVGGSWPGNPNSSTPFPAQMKIDYIHAYQAGSGTPTPPTTPTPPATPGDLTGTNAHDSLIGTAGANKINGLGGDDWLEGKGGNDTLTGGAGYDTFAFAPGSGQDTVTDFGKGDKLYLKGFVAAHKTPTLTQSGADTVVKFSSGESITLKGVASGSLTHSSDWGWIYGNAASSAPPSTPTPPATPGTTITGTARNDALVGKDGAETIKGLGGDDWLEGKKGNDFLSGGAGHDTFAFGLGSGKDTITDFDPTQDKIYMKGQVAGGHAPSITQAGADTVIHFSATDVVTLKNVDMHGLQHSADGFWLT